MFSSCAKSNILMLIHSFLLYLAHLFNENVCKGFARDLMENFMILLLCSFMMKLGVNTILPSEDLF